MEAFQADLEQTLLVVGNQVDLGGHDQSNIAKLNGRPFPVTGLEAATLSATWVFVPSSSGNWLKSWSSSFILNVDGTPFVRLEVDPFKLEGSWLQAHIQVTAESRLLGFRPGIEDFLEFAVDEELIPGKSGWKDALEPTRTEFRRKQFMAMVGDPPDWARTGLREIEVRAGHEEE